MGKSEPEVETMGISTQRRIWRKTYSKPEVLIPRSFEGLRHTQYEYRVSYYKVLEVILKADIKRDTASRSFNPFEDYFLCM